MLEENKTLILCYFDVFTLAQNFLEISILEKLPINPTFQSTESSRVLFVKELLKK